MKATREELQACLSAIECIGPKLAPALVDELFAGDVVININDAPADGRGADDWYIFKVAMWAVKRARDLRRHASLEAAA